MILDKPRPVTADITLSVTVTRDLLGLGPLEIGTTPDYYVAPQFLGAQVSWDRKQVTSPWMDGAVTVSRRRNMVNEQIGVEVRGASQSDMANLINDLIDAFTQDQFTMTVVAQGKLYQYRCEAADYQNLSWTTPRMVSSQGQVLFSVPRQPVERTGGY